MPDETLGALTPRPWSVQDAEVWLAGFHGYDDCPHLVTDRRGCPTPFMCSERGDCTRRRIDA